MGSVTPEHSARGLYFHRVQLLPVIINLRLAVRPGSDEELALGRNRERLSCVNIQSSYGHDALLLENGKLSQSVRDFLEKRVT